MERLKELFVFTTTDSNDDEVITGRNCPNCGYPTVYEYGLEVCYKCGWYEGIEKQEIN